MQAKEMKKVQRRAPVAYVEKKVKETLRRVCLVQRQRFSCTKKVQRHAPVAYVEKMFVFLKEVEDILCQLTLCRSVKEIEDMFY